MAVIVEQIDGEWREFQGTENLNAVKVRALVDKGVWTEKDLTAHGLVLAQPRQVAAGQRPTGPARIEVVNEKPVVVQDTAAIVQRVARLTIIATLTDQQLEDFLAALTLRQRETWYATTMFRVDDPILQKVKQRLNPIVTVGL